MLVDLQDVPVEGRVIDRSVSPSHLLVDSRELELERPVEIEGRLIKIDGNAYRLRGRVFAAVVMACVRCLESFKMEIKENLDLIYLPESANVAPEGKEDRALGGDELAVSFYRDDQIDLAQMILEQIVLALPMKPVCKEDCRGLCPQCGSNRNVKPCACVRDDVDPRWESLKSLL